MDRPTSLTRRSLLVGSLAGAAVVPAVGAGAGAQRASDETPGGIKKGRLKQSSVLWCYGAPLEELAQVSARLGLSGIDVVNPPDWPVLQKYGLLSTMTPCMERGFGIARGLNKKEHHEGHLQLVKERIDASAEAGISALWPSPRAPSPVKTPQSWQKRKPRWKRQAKAKRSKKPKNISKQFKPDAETTPWKSRSGWRN